MYSSYNNFCSATHFYITNDDIANGAPVRIYKPQVSTPVSLPVGVFFHGGGWSAGNLEAQDHFCRQIALAVPSIIVSVDYHLGPKYKMHVLIQDCFTAYKWVRPSIETVSDVMTSADLRRKGISKCG
jgi:acetyl esterase/lipase